MFENRPLREAISTQRGGGTPSRQVGAYWGGSIPWASVKDFAEGGSEILATQETITERGLRASVSNLIPPGTPLVCTRMAVGRCATAPMPIAINQDIKALVPTAATDAKYLLRLMQHARPKAEAVAVGSTVKGIRIDDYLDIAVPMAPSLEQLKIVAILDTLDAAIRQTEAIIEKLKQVKQGMLHDLLTRGIDDNGELRPPQSEAPHLYKKSALGWIPKAWDVLGLADMSSPSRSVLRTGPFGSSLKGEHLVAMGRPVVTIGSLGEGHFIESELLHVSESTALALADSQLLPGDIAFSRVADVGRSVVVEEHQRGWIMSSNFMRIAVDPCLVVPHFLQRELAFDSRVRRQIRATVNSAGRDVASTAILMSLRFAAPPVPEQNEVVRRARALDERTEQEESARSKLSAALAGLMDDLLTGRVRVNPLLA